MRLISEGWDCEKCGQNFAWDAESGGWYRKIYQAPTGNPSDNWRLAEPGDSIHIVYCIAVGTFCQACSSTLNDEETWAIYKHQQRIRHLRRL